MIQLKRAHEKPRPEDEFRVLVEPFWPRGLDEKHAKLGLWLKEVAPSVELHQEFSENPDPGGWEEFQRLNRNELQDKHKSIKLPTGHNLVCVFARCSSEACANLAGREIRWKRSVEFLYGRMT